MIPTIKEFKDFSDVSYGLILEHKIKQKLNVYGLGETCSDVYITTDLAVNNNNVMITNITINTI